MKYDIGFIFQNIQDNKEYKIVKYFEKENIYNIDPVNPDIRCGMPLAYTRIVSEEFITKQLNCQFDK